MHGIDESNEPPFWWMDLDEVNRRGLRPLVDTGELYGIVSEADGGIIAYANGIEHANQIVDALKRSVE